KDNYTNFTIENAKLFYENINSANIEKIKFSSLLFNSVIDINNVKLNKDLPIISGINISKIELSQNIFSFNNIKVEIHIKNSFIYGNIDLNKKLVTLNSKQIPKSLKPFFKKINKGYKYEYKF
ncbi:hypothetical protein, partial [Arcobacter sp. CECT 8985]|uniref:hypothetical protein n=1 Tax=Arcobacter sp. CECT 8985 TaxID=1935424 RepID=UPI0010265661